MLADHLIMLRLILVIQELKILQIIQETLQGKLLKIFFKYGGL